MAFLIKLPVNLSDNTFARFITAIGGTAGVALANFALAAFLLQTVAPDQFGVFTFVQVTIAFGCGISNALLGSPLMVALNRLETSIDGVPESYFKASLFLSLLASIPVWGTVVLLGESYLTATFFALAAILIWTRWFGRSYANAINEPARVAVSDVCYAIIVLTGAFVLFLWDVATIQTLPLIQIFASLVGLLALGWSSLRVQCAGICHGSLAPFWVGFQGQGRHALVGVVTTEATTNAHSYIVTLLLGPAAFAPLSASVLLFRPIPLVLQSLTQLERPRLSRLIRDNQMGVAMRAVRNFRITALVFWAMTSILAYVIVTFFLRTVIRGDYSPETIAQATLFWCVIMGIQCLRGPEGALIQANGDFRPLAKTTIISCLVTIPLVFLLVYCYGAIWSLGGIIVGEIVALLLIMQLARSLGVCK